MKKIILIFNLILWTSIMYGQYNIIPSEDLMAEFLKRYKRDTDNAFDFIFGTNELIANEKEKTDNIKTRIIEYKNTLGNFIGFEKIIHKPIGENLNVFVYLVRYEKKPLKFTFKYYKSKNEWILHKFDIDENIDADIDKIIEFELLNKY